MKYLYLIDPAETQLNIEKVKFVPPSYRIHTIEGKLDKILPRSNSKTDIFDIKRNNLIKNIAHRLNYLEFLNAILCCDQTIKNFNVSKSALCGGIPEMMRMTFCILTYSIFEGIGSHMVRSKANEEKEKTRHEVWVSELSNHLAEKDFPTLQQLQRKRKKQYTKLFNQLRDMRDRVHLDKPLDEHDYTKFNNIMPYRNAVRCLRILFREHLELLDANFVTIKL